MECGGGASECTATIWDGERESVSSAQQRRERGGKRIHKKANEDRSPLPSAAALSSAVGVQIPFFHRHTGRSLDIFCSNFTLFRIHSVTPPAPAPIVQNEIDRHHHVSLSLPSSSSITF